LAIELPREEIVPQLMEKSPAVETIIYVFDAKGSAVVAEGKTITFDAAERARKEPIVIRRRLDLPPGRYVAKAIARIARDSGFDVSRMEPRSLE